MSHEEVDVVLALTVRGGEISSAEYFFDHDKALTGAGLAD
jgi:hypothetical protein